jgi:hypothetical protein
MKRVDGIWYVNACSFIILHGRIEKTSSWIPAGTFERACVMAGGKVCMSI